jgi:hypothetical protein
VGRHFIQLAATNDARIVRLDPGMARKEVLEAMRLERDVRIPQPYRTVTHRTSEGATIEIWYYLVAFPTGAFDRSYLGPVVLKNGILAGTGWDLAREFAERYDIPDVGWWRCGEHADRRRIVVATCPAGPCTVALCDP